MFFKRFLLIFIFINLFYCLYSQRIPLIYNYYNNLLFLNPAYTGSRGILSSLVFFRNQWIGFDGAPKTFTFSVHTPLKNLNNAIGLNLFSDKIGVTNIKGLNFNYAYIVKLSYKKNINLSMGLKSGIINSFSEFTSIKINNIMDEVFLKNEKFTTIDAGFGLFLFSNNYFLSVSLPFLFNYPLNYDKNFYFKNMSDKTFILGGGYIIKLSENFKIFPYLFSFFVSKYKKVVFKNSLIFFDNISIGTTFSSTLNHNSISLNLEYTMNNKLTIGTSYEFLNLKVEKIANNTLEFFIRYDFLRTYNLYDTRFFKH